MATNASDTITYATVHIISLQAILLSLQFGDMF